MPKNTRRDNGEGSTPFQRADGRWQISIRVSNTTTGKPIRKTFTKKTRTEVVNAAKKYRNGLAQGVLADPARTTFGAWIQNWLDTIAARRVRERTLHGYRGYLRRWVLTQPEAKVPMETLSSVHVERIEERMRAAGRSETTVLQVHRILSKLLSDAVARGRLGRNPMLGIQAPKAEKFHPTVITPAKARELVTAAGDDDVWGPCFMLALALGPRQGERLGLCWDDLDLETGSVRIRRELGVLPWKHGCTRGGCGRAPSKCPHRHGGGFQMMETKSESGARTAALPSQLVAALKRQKAAQARWKVEEGTNWVGFVDSEGVAWDLVFTRRNGRPIDNKVDRAAWKEFTEAHGVEGMRVHDARHTAATVLLALGVDPRVVMDVMGWSQSSMLTRYQHVLDEMKVSAASKVGDALFGGPVSESEPAGGDRVVSLADFRTRKRS